MNVLQLTMSSVVLKRVAHQAPGQTALEILDDLKVLFHELRIDALAPAELSLVIA
jgi:hypothetical protein